MEFKTLKVSSCLKFLRMCVDPETHLHSSGSRVSEHQDVSVAAHGLNRVCQRLSLLGGRRGIAEMHDGATQTLHGCCKGAAGSSADLVEHGRHDFTLIGEDRATIRQKI